MTRRHPPYGLLVEFDTPDALIRAVRTVRAEGYRRIDACTPFPLEELDDVLGLSRTPLPLIVLLGGITGAISGFFLQYYISVISYPLDVGGRPLDSWPAFIPVTFEFTILFAALSGVVGMLLLNGLPHPYHPLFNVDRFALASRNRFFLCIEARDPMFDADRTRRLLERTTGREVTVVHA